MSMRVNVYDGEDTTKLLNVRYLDELADAFGLDDDEYYRAMDQLERVGRYWLVSRQILYLTRECTK